MAAHHKPILLFDIFIHKCSPQRSAYELCGPSLGWRWLALP